MKRTTVKLSDELDAQLRHEAARRGLTIGALTREALEVQLGITPRRRFNAAGAGRSGRRDISERMEELMEEMMREEVEP
jgi:predicted transcriptional regulator